MLHVKFHLVGMSQFGPMVLMVETIWKSLVGRFQTRLKSQRCKLLVYKPWVLGRFLNRVINQFGMPKLVFMPTSWLSSHAYWQARTFSNMFSYKTSWDEKLWESYNILAWHKEVKNCIEFYVLWLEVIYTSVYVSYIKLLLYWMNKKTYVFLIFIYIN